MKHILLGALGGAVLTIGMPAAAHAALLCSPGAANTIGAHTCLETAVTGPVTSTGGINTGHLTLDQFSPNASPGFVETLTEVDLIFGEDFHTTVQVSNTTTPFPFQAVDSFFFNPGAGDPSSLIPVLGSAGFGLSGVKTTFSGPTGNYDSDVTKGVSPVQAITNVAGFTGSGTFGVDVSAELNLDSIPGTNTSNLSTTTDGSIEITYDFTTSQAPPTNPVGNPVPEPVALSLLGVALVPLALARKRRRIG